MLVLTMPGCPNAWRRGTAIAAGVAWMSAVGPLAAGVPATVTISGHVAIRGSLVTVASRPAPASLGSPAAARPTELRPAVVYLESAPRGAFEPEGALRMTMDQRDQTFVPHVLAITVGTTVDFPNSDVTFHNVFSLSKTKRFDLGRYAKGKSKSVRFDRPGIVQVFCDIHSHMSAYILVFAHRYFDVTDGEGRYSLGSVPPGTYTVVVWHEGSIRDSRAVVVADDAPVTADFVVR